MQTKTWMLTLCVGVSSIPSSIPHPQKNVFKWCPSWVRWPTKIWGCNNHRALTVLMLVLNCLQSRWTTPYWQLVVKQTVHRWCKLIPIFHWFEQLRWEQVQCVFQFVVKVSRQCDALLIFLTISSLLIGEGCPKHLNFKIFLFLVQLGNCSQIRNL